MRHAERRARRYEASSPRSFACRRRGVFAAELRMPEAQSWPRTVFFAGNVKRCVTFVNWAEARAAEARVPLPSPCFVGAEVCGIRGV